MNSEVSSRAKDAGSSQKEMLFRRGEGHPDLAPIINGTIQLPNPPDHSRHEREEYHDEAVSADERVIDLGIARRSAGPQT